MLRSLKLEFLVIYCITPLLRKDNEARVSEIVTVSSLLSDCKRQDSIALLLR